MMSSIEIHAEFQAATEALGVVFVHAHPPRDAVDAANRASLLLETGIGRVAHEVVLPLTGLLVTHRISHDGAISRCP
jgi:hypothetical protein